MTIPDAAIEAAAEAIYQSETSGSGVWPDHVSTHPDDWTHQYRSAARQALSAGVPFVVADMRALMLDELNKLMCPVDDCLECRHHRELARIIRGGTP